MGAHPRSRGENPYAASTDQDPKGSSPLTRGKPQHVAGDRLRDGLIPAHAGKTPQPVRADADRRAHPRSRGENAATDVRRANASGSSPLMRGKRHDQRFPSLRRGLIPAHAGKTSYRSVRRLDRRAHPRSRGENRRRRFAHEIAMGSSPLTRGKHVGDLGVLVGRGLIPAHAGKTAPPRAVIAYSCGSSPLTRGKQVVLHVERNERGLIPAHAGKTTTARQLAKRAGAHPRSRGENGRHRPL